jgi:hypothetical protein
MEFQRNPHSCIRIRVNEKLSIPKNLYTQEFYASTTLIGSHLEWTNAILVHTTQVVHLPAAAGFGGVR